MLGRLFLLFTVVPALELWLLVELGGLIGPLPTVAMVIGAGFLGAYLARREGRRVFAQWQAAMAEGRLPEEGVIDGILVVVGAVLLITPGVLTDIVGLALFFRPSRRFFASLVRARFLKHAMHSVHGRIIHIQDVEARDLH